MFHFTYSPPRSNPKLLCVAGYTFRSQNSRLLDKDWRKMLRRYQLPYFRMSACNAGQAPFDHLTGPQCIAVATEAIALINQYAAFGYAVTVEQEAFNKVVTPSGRQRLGRRHRPDTALVRLETAVGRGRNQRTAAA